MRTSDIVALCLLLSACTLAHPSGTSAPPRRDGPIGLAEASFTFGEVSHETTGAPPNLDDSTHAVLTRVLFDIGGSRFGGGADLEFLTSDDDLHQSSGVGTELWQADIFPFFSQRFGGDQGRVWLRVGPFFNSTELEAGSGSVSVLSSDTFGARVAAVPEVDLIHDETRRLGLHGTLSLGYGWTIIDSDAFPDTFDSTAFSLGVEIGLRAQFSNFMVSLGYLHRSLNVDQSDVVGGMFIKEADYLFHGVAFSVGARW